MASLLSAARRLLPAASRSLSTLPCTRQVLATPFTRPISATLSQGAPATKRAFSLCHSALRPVVPRHVIAPVLRPPLAVRTSRLLCTSSGPSSGSSLSGTATLVQQAYMWARQNTTLIGVLFGSTLVMYGFYRFSMRVMKFFFNVSDKQIFEGGFFLGILSTLVIIGAGVYASRVLTFHVDDVYRAALRELRKHESVEKALGGVWHPGSFRGYAVESISEAMAGSERRARSSFFEAPSRRIQMIFTVKGMGKDGMVSLEAFKRSGAYQFEMLSVDIRGSDEHYFLLGDDDHALFPEVSELLESSRKGYEKR